MKRPAIGLVAALGIVFGLVVAPDRHLPNHVYEKHGMFVERERVRKPYRIVLHHTAGGTVAGAEATLKQRHLGYHYIITRNGVIYEYVPANKRTPHAYGNNAGTIGIAYVGGGRFGVVTPAQREATLVLIKQLKEKYPRLKEITGHKHVDPRGWKSDPRVPGEPVDKVDWEKDALWMRQLAKETQLTFIDRSHLNGR